MHVAKNKHCPNFTITGVYAYRLGFFCRKDAVGCHVIDKYAGVRLDSLVVLWKNGWVYVVTSVSPSMYRDNKPPHPSRVFLFCFSFEFYKKRGKLCNLKF